MNFNLFSFVLNCICFIYTFTQLPPSVHSTKLHNIVNPPFKFQVNSQISPSPNKSPSKRWPTLDGDRPLIFGHRGENVLAPEHTLYGYELAAILGADYIEPDLILTKDHQFICYHDLYLSDNTDVSSHPQFDKRKIQNPDGSFKWAVKDFTLKEIKVLRLKQKPMGLRPQGLNGIFEIPTFQEFLDRIHQLSFRMNKTLGILPELKEPTYHNKYRAPRFMENLLLTTLQNNGYSVNNYQQESCTGEILDDLGRKTTKKIKCPLVIIQSLELPTLEYLKENSKFDLLMLVLSDPTFLTPQGVQKIAETAKYYAIFKGFMTTPAQNLFKLYNATISREAITGLGGFIPPKEFPAVAHGHGLKLVVYTVYDSREPNKLGSAMTKREELNDYLDLGVDGIFVENVAESVLIRREEELRLEITVELLNDLGPIVTSGSVTHNRV